MKKYEYKTVFSMSKGLVFTPDKKLNELGSQGWEAVGISQRQNFLVILFKKTI